MKGWNDPLIVYKVVLKASGATVSITDAPRAFAAYLKQLNEANIRHEIRIQIVPPDDAAAERIRQRYAGRQTARNKQSDVVAVGDPTA